MQDFTVPLSKVLNQSEYIQNLVEECAEELLPINARLKRDLNGRLPSAEIEMALTQSGIVESKVEEPAAALSKALAEERDKRRRLDVRSCPIRLPPMPGMKNRSVQAVGNL
ncbi:MAG TPA: hypothetical protein VGO51_12105 [Burkholderiaceae bacterium]|nr:hypothetical protein [Burkholderiaceae bacterium]